MFERMRALRPNRVNEITPHLQFAEEPRPYGYYVRSGDWNVTAWSPYYWHGHFESSKKMVGPASKLDKNVHKCAVGRLDESVIGKLTIGEVSFCYDATAEVAEVNSEHRALTIVSAGVLHYLEGFDQQASSDIHQRVEAAIAEDRRRESEAIAALVNGEI